MSNWIMDIIDSVLFQPGKAPQAPLESHLPPAQGWSKDPNDCYDNIKNAYPIVKAKFESQFPGYFLQPDYAYRSPQCQFELFKKGRELQNGIWVITDLKLVVTKDDGINKLSHHNTWKSQALDFYVKHNGAILWPQQQGASALYVAIGNLWVEQGLIAGAIWRYDWKDLSHVQVAYDLL